METNSLYHASPAIHRRPWCRSQNSVRSYIIPGQGSAYPGMFNTLLAREEIFQQVFSLADKIAGFHDLHPVSYYISKPSALPTRPLPVYRNTALFCTQVAIGRTLLAKALPPELITGHSFGECAGLVIAGIISLEEMLSVVIFRNLICPPANLLGGMVTVSAELASLRPLLEIDGVYLANINSHRQVVLSFAAHQQSQLLAELRRRRLPHLLLTELPQPYHSPIMEPYRKQLASKLQRLSLTVQPPVAPFFSGIEHRWIDRENFHQLDYRALLAKQFTEPVNFVEQLEALKQAGATAFYEIGPGRMLETAIRNVIDSSELAYRDMETHLPLLLAHRRRTRAQDSTKGPWFTKIRDIIMSVTGYKEDDIHVDDSFQNDLGIDSLRKAEILVRLITEQGLSTGPDFSITRFSYIHEAVDYLESYREGHDPLMETHATEIKWHAPRWRPIARLRQPHDFYSKWTFDTKRVGLQDFSWKSIAAEVAASVARGHKLHLVVTQGSEAGLAGPHENLLRDYAEHIAQLSAGDMHVTVLSGPHDYADLAPVSAFFKSIAKETRAFTTGLVVTSSTDRVSNDDLLAEALNSFVSDVRLGDGQRLVRTMSALELTASTITPTNVLAIGGSKGIGFEILRHYPVSRSARLCLIGRTAAEHPSVREHLEKLRQCWKNFSYICVADLRHAEGYSEIRDFFKGHTVDLLINAAGVEVSRSLSDRTLADIESEVLGKLGPFHLAEELGLKLAVKRIFHFTSVVATYGNKGQSIYSWSNRWIEEHLGANSHAIAWCPWEGVGMTANPGLLQQIREGGVSLATSSEGAQLFWQLVGQDADLPKVLYPMDLKDAFLLSIEQFRPSSLGQFINRFEGVFYRDVDFTEEPFLRDHQLLEQPIVPAAYFLSQLINLTRSQFGHMVAIRNLELQNALFFQDGHCSFKLQYQQRPPYQFKFYSLISHAIGFLDPNFTLAPSQFVRAKRVREIKLSTFYDQRYFGKNFHFIKHARVDENKNLEVEVDIRALPALRGEKNFDMWLALIDSGFQAISLLQRTTDNGAIMPLGFESLAFVGDPMITETVFVLPQLTPRSEKSGIADVSFYNETGALVFSIRGVSYRLHYPHDSLPIEFGDWSC